MLDIAGVDGQGLLDQKAEPSAKGAHAVCWQNEVNGHLGGLEVFKAEVRDGQAVADGGAIKKVGVGLQRGQNTASQLLFLGAGTGGGATDDAVRVLFHALQQVVQIILFHADNVAHAAQGAVVLFIIVEGDPEEEPHKQGLGFFVPKAVIASRLGGNNGIGQDHGIFADIRIIRPEPVERIETGSGEAGDAPRVNDMNRLAQTLDAAPIALAASRCSNHGVLALRVDDQG